VKGLWQDLGGIVLLEVCDENAPRAEVVHTVPVETPALSAGGSADVLLFVKGGRLDSIELVNHAGGEPVELPPVEAVKTPTVNRATAGARQTPRDA
jgi:hypothetical protein